MLRDTVLSEKYLCKNTCRWHFDVDIRMPWIKWCIGYDRNACLHSYQWQYVNHATETSYKEITRKYWTSITNYSITYMILIWSMHNYSSRQYHIHRFYIIRARVTNHRCIVYTLWSVPYKKHVSGCG